MFEKTRMLAKYLRSLFTTKIFDTASQILKDASTMFLGSVSGQLLALLSTVLLARLIRPETLGEYGSVIAFVTILSSVLLLQLNSAIVASIDDHGANDVAKLAFVIIVSLSALIGALFVFGHWLLRQENIGILSTLNIKYLTPPQEMLGLFLVIVCAGVTSFYQIFTAMLNKTQKYSQLAMARPLLLFLQLASQLTVLLFAEPIFALVFGYFLGTFLCLVFIRRHLNKNIFCGLDWSFSSTIKLLLSKHKNFTIYRTLGALLDASATNLPLILVLYFFGALDAAYFALGLRIVNLPVGLLQSSLGPIIFERLAGIHTLESDKRLIKMSMFINLTGSLFFYGFLAFFSKFIIILVAGSEWLPAAVSLQLLCITGVFRSFIATFSTSLIAYQEHRVLSVIQILHLTSALTPFFLASNYYDFVCFYVLFNLTVNAIYCYFIFRVVSIK